MGQSLFLRLSVSPILKNIVANRVFFTEVFDLDDNTHKMALDKKMDYERSKIFIVAHLNYFLKIFTFYFQLL